MRNSTADGSKTNDPFRYTPLVAYLSPRQRRSLIAPGGPEMPRQLILFSSNQFGCYLSGNNGEQRRVADVPAYYPWHDPPEWRIWRPGKFIVLRFCSNQVNQHKFVHYH